MNDNDVINYINQFKVLKYSSFPIKYKKYLLNRYTDFYSKNEIEKIKEAIYRIKNNIDIIPKCPICGKPVKFSYNKYISICGDYHCLGKSCNKKRKNTFINKYGVKSNFSRQEVKDKIKNTNIEKYGVDNPWKTKESQEKCKNTIIKKYGGLGAASKDIKEKMEKTNIEKYGWKHNWQDPEEQKRSHSKEAKEKLKQTCLQKYGVDNVLKLNSTKEKRKQTWLNKYGVEYAIQNKDIFNKTIKTKKEKGTLNTSSIEEESYILIKEKYFDVIRQYRSEVYPFNCDFYIPSLDLYIECNYSWTHGFKPYSGSEEDLLQLSLWESKNTEYYNNAINTWTIRDVEKRKVAKDNNLNFLEFYTILDLKNWLNNE